MPTDETSAPGANAAGASRSRVLMLCPDCQMIDRRVLQQARTLSRAGYEVTLLSGFECPVESRSREDGLEIIRSVYDWDDDRLRRLRERLPRHDGLRMAVNRSWMLLANRFFRWSPFDRFILRKAREHPSEIVHVHDLPLLRHGAHIARERGAWLVFDSHEIYHEQACLSARDRKRLRREERRHVPRTDVFITVNESIADHFERLHGKRAMVLLNCAPTPPPERLEGGRAELRRRAGLPPTARIVLYQGWISADAHKNLPSLVLAAELLPEDVHVVLIGYGEYERELRELVRGRPAEARVHFLGRVEFDDLLPLTAGADVGVIPYQPADLNGLYCSPNKFFEFVQTGVPVVAQDLEFFRRMRDRHGVVATGDLSTAGGMAGVIREVLDDPERLRTLRESCARAAREICWEVEEQKLLAAYRGLLPPSDGAPPS